MSNLDSILKSRDITNKGPSSQSYCFCNHHVWIWELEYEESWAPKNWCFWTVMLEKTLRVPWTARRSNQSILKEISPEYLLEGLKLKWSSHTLAIWWKELTHWKRPWWWEKLKAGGEGDDRGWDGWMASLTRWTWVWGCYGSWWWTGRPGVHGVTKSWTRLSDWTELKDLSHQIPWSTE